MLVPRMSRYLHGSQVLGCSAMTHRQHSLALGLTWTGDIAAHCVQPQVRIWPVQMEQHAAYPDATAYPRLGRKLSSSPGSTVPVDT